MFTTEQVPWDSLRPGDKIVVVGAGIQTFQSVRFEGDHAIYTTVEGYQPKCHRGNWPEKATPAN